MADNYIESIEANVNGAKQDVPVRDAEAAHVFGNAGSHNSIFRGANLGTSVTDAQYQAIQAGTFDDLYIGDYWVINGVTWEIAAFDYYYGCGDTAFNKHHAVIVPRSILYNHAMNSTNTTAGAYAGSLMYTEGLEQAKTQIQQALAGQKNSGGPFGAPRHAPPSSRSPPPATWRPTASPATPMSS